MGRLKVYESDSASYQSIVDRGAEHNRQVSRTGRDIAPCPEIENRERRDAAFTDLKLFLETYFRPTFSLDWSEDHLKVIQRLQTTVKNGGQYALAMPRGSGKTSIVERAALWAILTGRRRFVVIVAANEGLAEKSLSRIKAELERNALLFNDWPKACYPLHRLESQSRRCVGQTFEGERTCIVWQRKHLVMPTMPAPDNEASGAVLYVGGLSGAIRGLSHVDSEGATIRPDLLLIDDPQDRESAKSAIQTGDRLALLNGDLLGLAGPGEEIAAVATATVIFRDDLADQLLDPVKSPAWKAERYKLIYDWPTRSDLWEEYLKLRKEGFLPHGDRGKASTEMYASFRSEMDVGGHVAWQNRFKPNEISAIQHAYNLRADRGDAVFASEYQNEPIDRKNDVETLDPVMIAQRCSGFDRGIAPPEVEKITAFIDLGKNLHWWMVCGWSEDFDCFVLDYNCFPEQRLRVFESKYASPTLDQLCPGGEEAAVHGGLKLLVDRLIKRDWTRSDGARLPLSRIMIDSGHWTETVRLLIRQSEHIHILAPTKGIGIGPGTTAMAEWKKHPGEKIGDGWIIGASGKDRLRLIRFDTNYWKTRLASMMTMPMGIKGGISLYGNRPIEHELLSLHLSSEYPTVMQAKGRTVNQWDRYPDRENHLLDALVGCAVGASIEGLNPLAAIGAGKIKDPERNRISFAAMYNQARARASAHVQVP